MLYKACDVPIAKGKNLSLAQCPKNEIEKEFMLAVSYANLVRSLMYAQVCTRPDIAYVVGVLGRYLSNLGRGH